jgi:hypothetical protein
VFAITIARCACDITVEIPFDSKKGAGERYVPFAHHVLLNGQLPRTTTTTCTKTNRLWLFSSLSHTEHHKKALRKKVRGETGTAIDLHCLGVVAVQLHLDVSLQSSHELPPL